MRNFRKLPFLWLILSVLIGFWLTLYNLIGLQFLDGLTINTDTLRNIVLVSGAVGGLFFGYFINGLHVTSGWKNDGLILFGSMIFIVAAFYANLLSISG